MTDRITDEMTAGGLPGAWTTAGIGLAAIYPRPATRKYNEPSALLLVAIQEALPGVTSPADALMVAKDASGLQGPDRG